MKLKRVYKAPAESDIHRILVDRLWPRGLSKEKAKIDFWPLVFWWQKKTATKTLKHKKTQKINLVEFCDLVFWWQKKGHYYDF